MRPAPKALAARVLYRCGAFDFLRWGTQGRLIVFNHHRIQPDTGSFTTSLDDGVFGATAAGFEQQVVWLERNTRLLSETELIGFLDSGRFPNEECSLITFDDGYLDNYALAYPVLKRLGATAIFFIPTDLLETRRLGWWDVIAYLVKKTGRTEITLDGRTWPVEPRARLIATLYERMKTEPADRTRDLLPRLAEACGVPLPDETFQEAQLMNWGQIREMARNGMGIGSHAHTHAVLSTLETGCQREELALSKAILEERTGRPVRSLAYPVGGPAHFTKETQRLARECGYAAAFSFGTGTNRWSAIDRYAIRRVSAPAQSSLAIAKAAIPDFFGTR